MITISGYQTVTLTTSTSGSIYNVTGITYTGGTIGLDTSSLGSGDAGASWSFYNGSDYNVINVGGAGQCVTYIWNGTSLIGI